MKFTVQARRAVSRALLASHPDPCARPAVPIAGEPRRETRPPSLAEATLEHRIARGGIAAFVIYATSAALTYGSQLVIARVVGADGYGIYAYVLAWMTILAYISALGFDVSLLRFVPAYQAHESWNMVRGVIQYAERRVFAAGFGIALLAAAVTLGGHETSPELTRTFIAGLPLVPVWALLWVRGSIVRAFGGVIGALAPDRMVRDGLLILLLGLAALSGRLSIDAPFTMAATLASSTVGLWLVTLAKRWRQPRALAGAPPAEPVRAWLQAAIPFVVVGACEAAMNRTGIVLLGWLGHAREAGVYALAFNVAFLAVLPRTAVNILFAPAISDLFARQNRAGLQTLVAKAGLWTFIGAACVALPFFVLAEPVLAFFGGPFTAGVPSLRILLIGQVIAAVGGSQLHVMMMTSHERGAAFLLVPSVAANAIATVLLIVSVGFVGAAIAAATTLALWNAAMAVFIWRRLRVLPSPIAVYLALRAGDWRAVARC